MLEALVVGLIGGPFVVEFVGYFWHRFIEHKGLFGKLFSHRHWVHHEVEYSVDKLRSKKYKNANSWSWYVLAILTITSIFLLVPLEYAIFFSFYGVLYAWFVVERFHSAFHLEKHWLHRYKSFQKLIKLHDIHHYDNVNYGIVFFGMDKIFGTFRNDYPKQKQNIFPNLNA